LAALDGLKALLAAMQGQAVGCQQHGHHKEQHQHDDDG
jgi:hypothetical protein